jgi:translation initiation factor 1
MEQDPEMTGPDRTVYSTERGDLRDAGKKKPARTSPPGMKDDGTVRVRRETGGRGGKTVTVIYGLAMTGERLEAFATAIKRACGAGGTVKDGVVIIQGDRVDAVIAMIEREGLKAKKSGN